MNDVRERGGRVEIRRRRHDTVDVYCHTRTLSRTSNCQPAAFVTTITIAYL